MFHVHTHLFIQIQFATFAWLCQENAYKFIAKLILCTLFTLHHLKLSKVSNFHISIISSVLWWYIHQIIDFKGLLKTVFWVIWKVFAQVEFWITVAKRRNLEHSILEVIRRFVWWWWRITQWFPTNKTCWIYP